MTFRDKLKLEEGQSLKHVGHKTKGFMEETDIDTYEVVDAAGAVVGSVIYTSHTAVKGFRITNTVEQYDAAGKSIVSETWHPRD